MQILAYNECIVINLSRSCSEITKFSFRVHITTKYPLMKVPFY